MVQRSWQGFSHLAIWVAFLSLPILMSYFAGAPPDPRVVAEQFRTDPPLYMLVGINLYMAIFYFTNYYVLIPKLLIPGRRRRYFASVAFALMLAITFFIWIRQWVNIDAFKSGQHLPPAFFALILFFSLIWAASSGLRFSYEYQLAEKARQVIVNEQLQSTLIQLKSQLNPHFLFNTLNGIYSLTLNKSEEGPKAIMRLSHLLRYVMADSNADKVLLTQEIAHLKHFIELHQIRLTDQTPVNFTVEGNTDGLQIAPLIFLPFVENAFKYGTSTQDYSPIDISIHTDKNIITFQCVNFIRKSGEPSTGIGVDNTQKRLQLIYPNRHNLNIESDGQKFRVNLMIQL
jgi:Histidine kinase